MARRWIAVEENDDHTCQPCSDNDNHLYSNRADAYADYPGGVGYTKCVGAQFGNKCRGMVKKRRGGGENSMNRIVEASRPLLADWSTLSKRLTNAAKVQSVASAGKEKEWFRFENLGTDEVSLFLYNDIGYFGTTADDFVQTLNAITAPKVNVHISSQGGEVFDALAIHTALSMHSAHIITHVDGVAASAASFIAMAGDTIKMARNATMMIHDASTLMWGNEEDMLACARLLGKLSDNIADMYAEQAGGTVDQWRNTMRAETWYTGQEALAAGLVDEIEGEDTEPATENALSSILFRYANRSAAPAPIITPPVEEHVPPVVEEKDAPKETNDFDAWKWRMKMTNRAH